ncbi:hypothetical protein [Microbulbifer taiwanensis]|uniref:hypothetical protein n=1 Tax=Microbulbifer taiwanensis TaxID=986746 RepID=UPI00360E4980
MKKNLLSAAVKGALGLTAAAIMVPVMPALAQEDANLVEEVVVTGSRIVRANLESPTAITTVDSQNIEFSGSLTALTSCVHCPPPVYPACHPITPTSLLPVVASTLWNCAIWKKSAPWCW